MYGHLIHKSSFVCQRCWFTLKSVKSPVNSVLQSRSSILQRRSITSNRASVNASASQTKVDAPKIEYSQTPKKPKYPGSLTVGDVNRFTTRSHACGQVDDSIVGQEVDLCGWIEFSRLGRFIVLRDCYGSVQLFIKDKQMQELAKTLSLESVIHVKGIVRPRPEKDVNPEMANGNVEVCINELTILNRSLANMPILAREHVNITEQTRLEYRYLDLRHRRMARNLRTRSSFIMSLRNCLVDQFGFVEVETPTLFKATPGGAQEFIVPTRFPNSFYSLVQSPQQFKQLLMVGGVDRYFQVARCYRDEGTKVDRQPEFTQLDIEMSFTSMDHVLELVENLLVKCWPVAEEKCQIVAPFRRIDYHTAMEKYGCDKPDLRSDIEIQHLVEQSISPDGRSYYMLVIPQEYDPSFAIKTIIEDQLENQIDTLNFKGLMYHFKWSSATFQDNLPKSIKEKLDKDFPLKANDYLWIASGDKANCLRLLGRIRANSIDAIENDAVASRGQRRKLSLLWVDEFPLFLLNGKTGQLESSHHPFTAPKASQKELVYSAPADVIGQNFDLVINGREIGGGSIRIIDHELQRYIFTDILKSNQSATMEYFMQALQSGCPPHGGFAIGLDRLLTLICQESSIRDVIAFPKAAQGKDLMADSPGPVDPQVKKLYHI